MKQPAIALLSINIEKNFGIILEDLKKIKEALSEHKEVKNILNLNIIAYFIDSNEVIPNFSSDLVDTYKALVKNVVNNNFCSKEDLIIEFKECLSDVATDLCNKIEADRILQDSDYSVEFEWVHDEPIQGVYPTEYHPNNLYREISHILFNSPQVIDPWRTEFNALILNNLILAWGLLANILKDQIMSESMINSFRKGVSIDFAFVDPNVDEWFDHFWIRLDAKVSNSSEVILINYRNDIRDADENILHLISQEVSISGYDEVGEDNDNITHSYSFTLGPEVSEITYDGKKSSHKTRYGHAYLYALMSKESKLVSYQHLYGIVRKLKKKDNKKELLIEEIATFISSSRDYSDKNELFKIVHREKAKTMKSLGPTKKSVINKITKKLNNLEQERDEYKTSNAMSKDYDEYKITLKSYDSEIQHFKKYIANLILDTNMDNQIKNLSNNVGKQVNKIINDFPDDLKKYLHASISADIGFYCFTNKKTQIKWRLFLKKTKKT